MNKEYEYVVVNNDSGEPHVLRVQPKNLSTVKDMDRFVEMFPFEKENVRNHVDIVEKNGTQVWKYNPSPEDTKQVCENCNGKGEIDLSISYERIVECKECGGVGYD